VLTHRYTELTNPIHRTYAALHYLVCPQLLPEKRHRTPIYSNERAVITRACGHHRDRSRFATEVNLQLFHQHHSLSPSIAFMDTTGVLDSCP
jgi:hypothetical protein